MRAFVSLVAAVCMIGFAMPAQAIGMQFCDDIKDDQVRMACLQQHITHLEETIVVLGGRVATLENALQKMLAADASYKLKSVAQGKCLGLDGDRSVWRLRRRFCTSCNRRHVCGDDFGMA